MPKSKEKRIWILTDTHLNHRMLIDRGYRPQGFQEQLIHNLWVVDEKDLFIHLGDICIGMDEEMNQWLLDSVPAKTKVLIRGNHDKKSDTWYYNAGWDVVLKEMWIERYGYHIVFSHEPLQGIAFENIVNIHGHTHGNSHRDYEHSSWYNPKHHREIALELNGYTPVLLTDKLVRGS